MLLYDVDCEWLMIIHVYHNNMFVFIVFKNLMACDRNI